MRTNAISECLLEKPLERFARDFLRLTLDKLAVDGDSQCVGVLIMPDDDSWSRRSLTNLGFVWSFMNMLNPLSAHAVSKRPQGMLPTTKYSSRYSPSCRLALSNRPGASMSGSS